MERDESLIRCDGVICLQDGVMGYAFERQLSVLFLGMILAINACPFFHVAAGVYRIFPMSSSP